EIKAIDKAVRVEMDKAVADSIAAQEPDLKELFTDIYKEGTEPPTVRGVTPDLVHHY
ncbi:hypothetical protein BC833DRAFT_622409, partial [Globomyces pollinis-pini]